MEKKPSHLNHLFLFTSRTQRPTPGSTPARSRPNRMPTMLLEIEISSEAKAAPARQALDGAARVSIPSVIKVGDLVIGKSTINGMF